ncbi:MAG: hypothetical protein NDJ89_05440 [Oligoflexia bacterium]|nr:hypothetical protein [Oligoflexia bacterium]
MTFFTLLLAVAGSVQPASAETRAPSVLLSREKCHIVEAVAVAKDRNIVAAAQCLVGANYVRKVFKFTPAGGKLWATRALTDSFSALERLMLDDQDNILLIGRGLSDPENPRRAAALMVKASATGVLLWSRELRAAADAAIAQDDFFFASIATDRSEIYLAGTHVITEKDGEYLGNGITSSPYHFMTVSPFFLKFDASGTLKWRQDEAPVLVSQAATYADYSWMTGKISDFASIVNNTLFPLSIVFKNGLLYTQHGNLRKVRDGLTGSEKTRITFPYFFGSLNLGRDGRIYSYGTSTIGAYHPIHNHELIGMADDLGKLSHITLYLPPSDFSGRPGTLYPKGLLIDSDGSLFVTTQRCLTKDEGCGVYTARLTALGSTVWDSVYANMPFYGSLGQTLAADESDVYVAAAFGQEIKVAKGVLKFRK